MEQFNEQRSAEWKEQRRGSFTSSRIHELMAVKGLGVGADSYCFELAIDTLCGLDESGSYESFDMQRGNELEPIAFQLFKEKKAADFIDVANCGYIALNKNTGGSPDGVTSDNGLLEIKCPKREKFFKLLYYGLPAIDQLYIDQMQHQMWVAGKSHCYFFNLYVYNGNPITHEILVPRDPVRIDLISQRVSQAIPIRDMYIEKLLLNKQW
jgi:hypothetical protein